MILKENWHLAVACILGLMLIVIAIIGTISLTGDFQSDSMRADKSKKSIYLVGISQADVRPFIAYDKDIPTGLDIDIIRWIAQDAGISITFVPMSSLGMAFDALRHEEIDMLISGMSITPDRIEDFLFSDPYLSTEQQIAVTKESTLTLHDFYHGDGIIGADLGSSGYETVEKLNIRAPSRLHGENGLQQLTKNLVSGQIDFMVTDRDIMMAFVQDYPIKVIGSISTGEEYGIMFPKNNVSLQKMVNRSLKKLFNSSHWDVITSKYFISPP